jgi:hypothetical protein
MNEEQLTAIRQRAEAATPGPWMTGALNPYRDRAVIYQTSEAQKVNPFHWQVRAICREVRANDADFLEHARADIPALLDAVARLRAALTEIAEADPWVTKSDIGRRFDIDTAKRALGVTP